MFSREEWLSGCVSVGNDELLVHRVQQLLHCLLAYLRHLPFQSTQSRAENHLQFLTHKLDVY